MKKLWYLFPLIIPTGLLISALDSTTFDIVLTLYAMFGILVLLINSFEFAKHQMAEPGNHFLPPSTTYPVDAHVTISATFQTPEELEEYIQHTVHPDFSPLSVTVEVAKK